MVWYTTQSQSIGSQQDNRYPGNTLLFPTVNRQGGTDDALTGLCMRHTLHVRITCLVEAHINCSHISFRHWAVKSESQNELLSISRHTCQILKESMSITYKCPLLLLQVILVSANKLTRYIEPCQLTEDFGGTLTYDHMDWLNKRLVSYLWFGVWGFFNVSFLSPEMVICVGNGHMCSCAVHLHE